MNIYSLYVYYKVEEKNIFCEKYIKSQLPVLTTLDIVIKNNCMPIYWSTIRRNYVPQINLLLYSHHEIKVK